MIAADGAEMLENFISTEVNTSDTRIYVRGSGSGAPILLLHGLSDLRTVFKPLESVRLG